jgi:transcriptional regulator with GAF, ATPase, and Fis domain
MLHAEHIREVLGIGAGAAARSLRDRLAAVTRNEVIRALRENDGNKSAAARSIPMSRSGFRKAVERLGLER